MVPGLIYLFGAPVYVTMGTSLATMIPLAVVGGGIKLIQGYVAIGAGLLLAAGNGGGRPDRGGRYQEIQTDDAQADLRHLLSVCFGEVHYQLLRYHDFLMMLPNAAPLATITLGLLRSGSRLAPRFPSF
ncbi:MAG: hypothetical protein MZV70_74840 [Desulfobacterales bacterium]|nr:hypothetical protein [Desulfobacterales bacterium]